MGDAHSTSSEEQVSTAERFDLDPRHARFVDEYLVHLNGARACRDAGFGTEQSANRYYAMQASRLMARDDIRKAISELSQERADSLGLTADRVLREMMSLATSSIENFTTEQDDGQRSIDLSGCTSQDLSAIQELTVDEQIMDSDKEDGGPVVMHRKTKLRLYDKRSALELLGKHLKLWLEKNDNPLDGAVIHVVTGIEAAPGSQVEGEAAEEVDDEGEA